MEVEEKTIQDFKEILKRRKWSLIAPALIVFIIAVVVAFALPPVYRSTATILIEEQEIPKEYVVASVTGFAEQRLQTINQTIMSTTRLLEIMNRYGLYAEMKDRFTTEEIVETLRKDIKFETISADVVGRSRGGTIAFTVSYKGKNPGIVQQVTNVLASLYLEENLKLREHRAKGTSRFLEEEANTVHSNLEKLEAKISALKLKNLNTLPELMQMNLQSLDRIEGDIEKLKDQLQTFKEKESYLQTQLAHIRTESPKDPDQDRKLLKELKTRLLQLQSRFSDMYPDVINTKKQIEELEKRIKSAPPPADDPAAEEKRKVAAAADLSYNPAYVTLASQLAATQVDIDSVQRQIQDSTEKRDAYRRRLEATPGVDESIKMLLVERNNTQLKYDDLMKKVMEARVSEGLEKTQMGERFTLIDPPMLPQKPASPNRPAILFIGVVLAIGAGIGSASLREYLDTSVRSARQVTASTSIPVLALLPEIVTWKDNQKLKRRRINIAVGAALVLLVGVVVFHFFVMDIDVVWARVLRKLRL